MKQWLVLALIAAMVAGVQAQEGDDSSENKGKKKSGAFAAMDADKDGKVSMDEFVAFNQKKSEKAGKEFDAEKCVATFKKKDKNQDEVLTKDEMAPPKKDTKKDENKTESDTENGDGE